jgi:hypothetical protein
MPSSTSRPVSHERWRLAALWLGILAGPTVWLALLEANFVLAFDACRSGTWALHLTVAVATAAVAACGWLAWAVAQGRVLADESNGPPLSIATRDQRARWMSLTGVALSIWFVVVILAMEVPMLVLGVCQ